MTMEKDIGAHIASRAGAVAAVTAGGGGDGAEVDGEWIDRQGFKSCVVVITYEATLGDGETLTLAGNLQDATDSAGTGAADFGDALASAVVATGGTGGSTERGTEEIEVNLTEAERFIRAQFTPTLSAGTTDTANVAATIILGGPNRKPAS